MNAFSVDFNSSSPNSPPVEIKKQVLLYGKLYYRYAKKYYDGDLIIIRNHGRYFPSNLLTTI